MATKIFKVGNFQFESDGMAVSLRFGKKQEFISMDDTKELFDWLGSEVLGGAPAVLPESFAKVEIALPKVAETREWSASDAAISNRRVPDPEPVLPKGTEMVDMTAMMPDVKPSGKHIIWTPES